GWCFLAYRAPGNYNTLFEFTSASDQRLFPQFWAVKRGTEILYEDKTNSRGRHEYRDRKTNKVWSRSDSEGVVEAIVVEDNGAKIRFEAELNPDRTFKAAPGEPVRYVEAGGRRRVMTDNDIGRLSTVRWGNILANLLLNFLHLVFWFAVLWLALRFQWGHALGLAAALWVVVTLTILPPLFKRMDDAGRSAGKTMA